MDYNSEKDKDKYKKAFDAGSSTGKGAWERLKEIASSAAEKLGVKDEEDPVKAAKEKRKKELEEKYGKE